MESIESKLLTIKILLNEYKECWWFAFYCKKKGKVIFHIDNNNIEIKNISFIDLSFFINKFNLKTKIYGGSIRIRT